MEKKVNIVYEATPRQALFHAAPEPYKLYGGAMGGGKTMALCAEGIALSCEYPGNRGYICRNTLAAFKKTTLLTLDSFLSQVGIVERHHQTDAYYLLKNGSTIMYGGLGDDVKEIDKLKSMELGWFAIDEASETSEKYFLMLVSRLRLKLPKIQYYGLLASNPDAGWLKNRFIDKKLPDHIFIPALPRDNPHLPSAYTAQMEKIFPPEWQQRFLLGDWTAFEGINNVFPFIKIRGAMDTDTEDGIPIELGMDVARYGDDETVIALRSGNKGQLISTTSKSDLMASTGLAAKAIRDHGPSASKIDADGLGSGVVDRLRELGYNITEIRGGERAEDPNKFRNRKAEIYWQFRERLIENNISLPDDLELQAQLTSCEYRINSAGQIEIVSKEEMKRRGFKSPDRAEAMIYAFADNVSPTIGWAFGA